MIGFSHSRLKIIAACASLALNAVFVFDTAAVYSQESQESKLDFEQDIASIFQKRCFECHGESVREGGLRLTNRQDGFADNDSGTPAIVAGRPDQSLLLARVTSKYDSDRMPPDGDPLSDSEIKTLTRWITEGADWPETNNAHWAYLAPSREEVSTSLSSIKITNEKINPKWISNPIDLLVLQQLENQGLTPSPESDPARLIRRASLALTGLPPSVKQVDAFVANPTDAAYEKFVDQCIESPRYGERWAQPWLDLARYADSNGFQADQLRESWAYRDWVIKSINNDMPFNQFTIEQLAGDMLPDATEAQKIATGFHRTVTCNVEAGVHPEQNRVNQIFDRVNTTGTVFLGTTIECCQCHNHKYDPFTQDDYYQLFAFFNNTPLEVKLNSGVQYNFSGPSMALSLSAKDQKTKDRLSKEIVRLEKQKIAYQSKAPTTRVAQLKNLLELAETPIDWQPLNVLKFESTGGESSKVLDDESVLISGSLPDTTTYTLTAKSRLEQVTAFRLEALTHPSLPGTGPGRGDEIRANFILNEFRVEKVTEITSGSKDKFATVKLKNATADFSQKNWNVANAIDGKPKTGWAVSPKFFKPHWATFVVDAPAQQKPSKNQYRFTLDQNYGRGRTLGRIRISGTSANPIAISLPDAIRNILQIESPNKKQMDRVYQFLDARDPELLKLKQQIAAAQKKIDDLKTPTTLVMVEMDEMRDTFKLKRGDYLNPGKKIKPGVPNILHSMPDSLPRNRLGLAKWLVDPANPLVGRVTVNRWWSNFFGSGLVQSEEDFGTQSIPPTHRELLDWLAIELVDSGWSRKHIHKLIVMSSTFRQSSRITPRLLKLDPKNKFYGRGPRFRMPAEMIRDNSLAVSGLLSTKMYGPPVMPHQPDNIWRSVGRNAPKWKAATTEDRNRRGVYIVWRRAAPYPSFVNFDAPDRASCVVKRPRTNTPLQALTLLNDKSYLEMAIGLADQVIEQLPNGSPSARIELAMKRCVSRTPSAEEIKTLHELYESELVRLKKSPETAAKFLKSYANVAVKRANHKTQPSNPIQPSTPIQRAAMAMVASVLLNLDETINY
ncbi:MAG: PSD1 and planctomycete cytochrome C domain-containing protein [Mariniblastus sp.]